jgi:hypothetical protein
MPAAPADIGKFTSDGVVITASDSAIKTNHPEAEDQADQEIEMFFDTAADAQVLLDERFAILSQLLPEHEAAVVDESLALGSAILITPTVPCFRVIDEDREIDKVLRMRAYAYEAGADHFSIELMA